MNVIASEFWADSSHNKRPLCTHFMYLSRDNHSFMLVGTVDTLRAISPGCYWWKILCSITQHLDLMTAALSLLSTSFLFYLQNTYDGKRHLLKDFKVRRVHVHEVPVPCQFFNIIFSHVRVCPPGSSSSLRKKQTRLLLIKTRWYLCFPRSLVNFIASCHDKSCKIVRYRKFGGDWCIYNDKINYINEIDRLIFQIY